MWTKLLVKNMLRIKILKISQVKTWLSINKYYLCIGINQLVENNNKKLILETKNWILNLMTFD